MTTVEVSHVSKHYGATAALDDVSITFVDGEMFCLLGPSGSGKTTLLRAIAGFVIPDAGTIHIDGTRVDDVPVNKRDIGMVFQNYALFPHMTVRDNIAFGVEARGGSRAEADRGVAEMLELVQLTGYDARKPAQLSGGQQQRVALARALVTRPKVLLLDEPLGALDRRLRQEMQVELRQIQRNMGITTVFVTHDQEEALTLSDRIAILDHGRIVQVGAPQDVYERPCNGFAAKFLGDANVLEGKPKGMGIQLADGTLIVAATPGASKVAIRPEKMIVVADSAKLPGDLVNRLKGTVLQAVYSGNSVTYRIACPGAGPEPMLAFVQNSSGKLLANGAPVTLAWAAGQTVALQD
jgi:ABC-type Fe3+/spermidine/putrescine transport system ATPase subunit